MAPCPRDVVVVGASAGGVEALRVMAAGLPAAILVVPHMPAGGTLMRSLEEKAALSRRMATFARERGNAVSPSGTTSKRRRP
jgi:chemotaxis response regulator CheB